MTQHEDINDLERIAMGDHEAFRSIFMKYFPKTKYFIAHIIKSEMIAEELSQDIFLRVWENRENVFNIRSFNAFIYKTSRNSALNYLKHKFVEESYIANYPQLTSTNPEEELDAKELEFLIQLAVDRMPEQRRKIYIMSHVENLEKEEIAEKLGLTKKTVKNQLSLAMNDIRKIISLASLFFF
jgi:RNA polymerase sigma-70 factor (ECF subfamily)